MSQAASARRGRTFSKKYRNLLHLEAQIPQLLDHLQTTEDPSSAWPGPEEPGLAGTGMIQVRRQVKLIRGRPIFAPPKGGRTREVPLSETVKLTLSAHLADYPAVEVSLPWKSPDGELVTVPLVFTTRERGPLTRRHYNVNVWKPALVKAGLEPVRKNGMHALRHFYASTLLDGGESIRAVADYLGHADPGFTLRTYTHLMPSSEARARRAIDAALGTATVQDLRREAREG